MSHRAYRKPKLKYERITQGPSPPPLLTSAMSPVPSFLLQGLHACNESRATLRFLSMCEAHLARLAMASQKKLEKRPHTNRDMEAFRLTSAIRGIRHGPCCNNEQRSARCKRLTLATTGHSPPRITCNAGVWRGRCRGHVPHISQRSAQ